MAAIKYILVVLQLLELALAAKSKFNAKNFVRTTPSLFSCLTGLAMPGSLKTTKRYERHSPMQIIFVIVPAQTLSTVRPI